jgi:hypothetical protein
MSSQSRVAQLTPSMITTLVKPASATQNCWKKKEKRKKKKDVISCLEHRELYEQDTSAIFM